MVVDSGHGHGHDTVMVVDIATYCCIQEPAHARQDVALAASASAADACCAFRSTRVALQLNCCAPVLSVGTMSEWPGCAHA